MTAEEKPKPVEGKLRAVSPATIATLEASHPKEEILGNIRKDAASDK